MTVTGAEMGAGRRADLGGRRWDEWLHVKHIEFVVGCPYGHTQQTEGRSTCGWDLGHSHTCMEFVALESVQGHSVCEKFE